MKKYKALHSLLWTVTYCALLALSGHASATPAEEAQLEELNKIERDLELQREWAKYRWEKASVDCYEKYWVNRCLSQSRAEYRKEIDPIRVQEVELHAVQRQLRASLKDQRDAKKAAERVSPEAVAERAANEREFADKQKEAAARAADLEQRRQDAPKRARENKAGTQLD